MREADDESSPWFDKFAVFHTVQYSVQYSVTDCAVELVALTSQGRTFLKFLPISQLSLVKCGAGMEAVQPTK